MGCIISKFKSRKKKFPLGIFLFLPRLALLKKLACYTFLNEVSSTPNTLRGLTLIEVLVVIAIIGILAAVISVNAVQSGKIFAMQSDKRILRILQSAVELYKIKKEYPPQCVTTNPLAQGWSGQIGTNYECDDGSTQYITGLAPKYIPVLPQDPKINGFNSGYVYRTNADGTVYKIMAMRTVESESVDYYHEFKSCDIIPAPPSGGHYGAPAAYKIDVAGWCRVATLAANEPTGSINSYGPIPHCLKK